MELSLENIRSIAQERRDALTDFTQQIIAIPSLPGQERDVAAVISNEMTELGYDDVWTDQAGNIIGKINGGDGPPIILNGHMDHVDTGPIDEWPYPPFEGRIVDGNLWGRASADMKGPVACMIYAASFFKQMNTPPPGDVFMTVAVMEEVGGIGAQHLAAQINAQAAICGEPSSNTLRRGHRGRVELLVDFEGRSAHASQPTLGVNPHYAAADFLTALSTLEMGQDATLGPSTVVPTLYSTDQFSPNVIPSHVYLTLDWRNVPSERPEDIVANVQALLDACVSKTNSKTALNASVAITSDQFTTYTGLKKDHPSIFPSYILPEDHRVVQAAHKGLVDALGRDDGIDIWRFATDGGHLMEAGIPTVGFGPGDETLAHTNQECISLAEMEEATVGYIALILAISQALAE